MFLTHLVCSACGTEHDAAGCKIFALNVRNRCSRNTISRQFHGSSLAKNYVRELIEACGDSESCCHCRKMLSQYRSVKAGRHCSGPTGSATSSACRICGSKMNRSTRRKVSKPAECQSPFRWRNILVRRNSRCRARETPVARLPPTPLAPDWRRTFSCPATPRKQTLSNAVNSVPM